MLTFLPTNTQPTRVSCLYNTYRSSYVPKATLQGQIASNDLSNAIQDASLMSGLGRSDISYPSFGSLFDTAWNQDNPWETKSAIQTGLNYEQKQQQQQQQQQQQPNEWLSGGHNECDYTGASWDDDPVKYSEPITTFSSHLPGAQCDSTWNTIRITTAASWDDDATPVSHSPSPSAWDDRSGWW